MTNMLSGIAGKKGAMGPPLDGAVITVAEQPLLGQPFYMLHPCETAAFMRTCLSAAPRSTTTQDGAQDVDGHGSDSADDWEGSDGRDSSVSNVSRDDVLRDDGGDNGSNEVRRASNNRAESVAQKALGSARADGRYLVLWAGLMAPAVGLRLPLGLACAKSA